MSDILHQDYLTDKFVKAYPETRAFWEAAERDEFLLKSCEDCLQPHWYPRIVCPHCGSANTLWIKASGRGTVYSYSHVERAEPPYILAYVRLQEGPMLITNILESEQGMVQIDAPVQVTFRRTQDGRKMPYFRIVDGQVC